MFNKPKQQITELTMLRELIESMEKRGIENPEYLIRNIELLGRIINILKDFKEDLKKHITTT